MHTLEKTSDGSFSMLHSEHGECFHSQVGAKTEAQTLYIERSGLQDRLAEGQATSVLDVGLGLGYNALAAMAAWCATPQAGELSIDSLEIDAELVAHLVSGEAPWSEGWPDTWQAVTRLLRKTDFGYELRLTHLRTHQLCTWRIFIGDARSQDWQTAKPYDVIWQDPFSPKHNPDLWSKDWFAKIRGKSAEGARLVTYSVARVVRDGLSDAGWQVARIPAAGEHKKQWLMATLPVANAN